jgi:hypothetical protein
MLILKATFCNKTGVNEIDIGFRRKREYKMNQQKAEEKTTLNQDDMLEVDHFLRFIQLRTKRTITLVVHTVIHSLAVF